MLIISLIITLIPTVINTVNSLVCVYPSIYFYVLIEKIFN